MHGNGSSVGRGEGTERTGQGHVVSRGMCGSVQSFIDRTALMVGGSC